MKGALSLTRLKTVVLHVAASQTDREIPMIYKVTGQTGKVYGIFFLLLGKHIIALKVWEVSREA